MNYNPESRFLGEIPEDLMHRVDASVGSPTSAAASSPRLKRVRPLVDASVYKVGDEVEHEKWGRGLIIDIARSAVGLEAVINFPEAGGEKRLDLSLAPLRKTN